MAQSDFALRMLEKQGWKEGDGLGRNRDGISKPIKAFMKRDKAGVGQDLGSDLTDHWWLKVFNDAAKSNVTTTVQAEVKKNSLPQNRLYAAFRKGSTLKEGKEEKDSDCSSEDEVETNQNSSGVPTLDDIHKYCGGATGHRAATLGIKMTGKLTRAAEHERLFNEKIKHKAGTKADGGDELVMVSNSTEIPVKKKKKKKKTVEESESEAAELSLPKSKKRKDNISCDEYLNSCDTTNAEEVGENAESESPKRKKSKKKKSKREVEDEQSEKLECLEDETVVKKRKKSKRKDDKHSILEESTVDSDNIKKHKRKKKRKHED